MIQAKWDDVLYISNIDTAGDLLYFAEYQWYKIMSNGDLIPINVDGNKQYYQVTSGKATTFIVEVTYVNGDKIMSCPFDYTPPTKNAGFKVYPNPVMSNENLQIVVDLSDEQAQKSTVEIIDGFGRLLYNAKLTGQLTELPITIPTAGKYTVRVTDPRNNVMTQTIVILK